MQDEKRDETKGCEENETARTNLPSNPCREVTVNHLDAPPPSPPRRIHPRRPAPPVPTHEQRTGEQPTSNSGSGKPPLD